MPFTAPTFESIRDGMLRDIRNQQPDADIGSDSDHYVRAASAAAAIEGIYQNLAWLYRQIWPDTSDEAELLHHASDYGLSKKEAVAAAGFARVTGAPGTVILQGTVMRHIASGTVLLSTAVATVDASGLALVPVSAQDAGTEANGLTGVLLLTSPPLGADAGAELDGSLVGGLAEESSMQLLARLLERLRNPPAGGAAHDYRRWALEIPGVSDAIVLPRRRGANTVDICIVADGGVPSDATVEAVQAHIEAQCTVTTEVFVFVPLVQVVDVLAQVELEDGATLEDVQAAAEAALAESIGALAPGERLYRSRIETVLSNLPGIVDRRVISPASSLDASNDPLAIGWIRLGSVTLELMA